ncbi:hypothetical protein [Mycolicibacterium palauense]|uniref:hypothetical protein n=1 Tax=Mycolicibacterium palauense TaxID=2034511 RepID=UPI000BFEC5ED|nr:hypothetical protein [Mycolicibacterium palauense]
MDQPDTDKAMSARDEVLLRGLIDWVPLQRLNTTLPRNIRHESTSMIQRRVIELIRSLVDGGLAELGDLNGPDDRFAPWRFPLDESIDRIRRVYVDHFAEDTIWPWYAWLNLAAKGEAAAQRIESGLSG